MPKKETRPNNQRPKINVRPDAPSPAIDLLSYLREREVDTAGMRLEQEIPVDKTITACRLYFDGKGELPANIEPLCEQYERDTGATVTIITYED